MNNRVIKVFGKQGCPGCLNMHPIVMELVEEGLPMEFFMREIHEDTFIAEGVKAMPTFQFYEDGVLYSKIVGEVPKDEIKRVFTKDLSESKSEYETRHEEYGW